MDDETRARFADLEKRVTDAEMHSAEVETKLVDLANQTTKDGLTLTPWAQGKLTELLERFYGGEPPAPTIDQVSSGG